MKVKTSELIRPALDWAVAKCEGHHCEFIKDIQSKKPRHFSWLHLNQATRKRNDPLAIPLQKFSPSTNWSLGGPIIDMEKIDCLWMGSETDNYWRAEAVGGFTFANGDTFLIAAMRCYVASKLGDEVEIPEELK